MSSVTTLENHAPAYVQAFDPPLSMDDLRRRTPAAFAASASERTKSSYRFINTAAVLGALLDAGFRPSAGQQTRSRAGSDPAYARHMIRLRPVREQVTLLDCIPEICLVNAHDGTSAYQLLAGLYRPLCANGLLCRLGDFAVIRIPHRSSVIADVVAGAIEVCAQFGRLRSRVQAMAERLLDPAEQLALAHTAYHLRWARSDTLPPFPPARLLEPRRPADDHPTLWHTLNRCQEAALAGGIHYHSATKRLVTTRRIRNIREEVRINTALWQAAERMLAA
ncbi:MAG: DUF932 domain-containing protein [Steroidobacteraceae bacterium]